MNLSTPLGPSKGGHRGVFVAFLFNHNLDCEG